MANQIYFTADLHFGHANILKHSPNRPFSDTVDIKAHDEWLLDLWRSTVDKRDTIYILGDLKKISNAGCTTFAEYAKNNYKSEVR